MLSQLRGPVSAHGHGRSWWGTARRRGARSRGVPRRNAADADAEGAVGDSQVARDGRAGRLDGRRVRRAVLVRLAVAGDVDEAERVRVVEQRVEDRAGVEDGDLPEVSVVLLERLRARDQLVVVVREGGSDCVDSPGPALNN